MAYDPFSLRWSRGVLTVDDPITGQRVPLEHVQQKSETVLPPAAQAVLDADPHLSREQAAAFLGVAAATLAEWASKSRGPSYLTIGASVQYPLSALVAWRSQQVKNRPAAPPEKRGRGRPRRVPL